MSENIVISLLGVASSMLLVNWRLAKLEKKVDEHNGWGQKFADQNLNIAVMKNDIEYIKKAVDKLGK